MGTWICCNIAIKYHTDESFTGIKDKKYYYYKYVTKILIVNLLVFQDSFIN